MLTNKGYSVEIDETDFNIIKDHTIRLAGGYYGVEHFFRELFERHKGLFRLNRKPGYKLKKEYRKHGRIIMASITNILNGSANNNTEMGDVTLENNPPFLVRSPNNRRVHYNKGNHRNSNPRPLTISYKNANNTYNTPNNTNTNITNIGIKAKKYLRNEQNTLRRTNKNRRTP
jgi:hypothetical protein